MRVEFQLTLLVVKRMLCSVLSARLGESSELSLIAGGRIPMAGFRMRKNRTAGPGTRANSRAEHDKPKAGVRYSKGMRECAVERIVDDFAKS